MDDLRKESEVGKARFSDSTNMDLEKLLMRLTRVHKLTLENSSKLYGHGGHDRNTTRFGVFTSVT